MTKSEGKRGNINQLEWCETAYADQFFNIERPYLTAGLRQTIGPTVLQLGRRLPSGIVDDFDLPFLLKSGDSVYEGDLAENDLLLDPAFLPFSAEEFSTVVLPHILEGHELPHQVLREAHRVLMNEGHIVITGFNPVSLIGLQRWLQPRAVYRGRYYSQSRVSDWLQLLGFEVVNSAMFHYAPLSRSRRVKKGLQFLESAGNRWLPMSGGGYMISAKKREAGGTMVGRVRFSKKKPKLGAPAVAKTHIKSLRETK